MGTAKRREEDIGHSKCMLKDVERVGATNLQSRFWLLVEVDEPKQQQTLFGQSVHARS